MAELHRDQEIRALVERGEREGCIDLSELAELAEALEMDDEEATALQERLTERGIALEDDCGQVREDHSTYRNEELAETTTDALQLFFGEISRHPLLTREQEVELAKRVERGDLEAKEKLINSNLRLV